VDGDWWEFLRNGINTLLHPWSKQEVITQHQLLNIFIGLFLTATKEVVVIIGEQGPVYLYV